VDAAGFAASLPAGATLGASLEVLGDGLAAGEVAFGAEGAEVEVGAAAGVVEQDAISIVNTIKQPAMIHAILPLIVLFSFPLLHSRSVRMPVIWREKAASITTNGGEERQLCRISRSSAAAAREKSDGNNDCAFALMMEGHNFVPTMLARL
jgi:hypothetical protein